MRTRSVLLCAVVLFAAGAARAADDDARAVLEKAIKAHGGEEKLKKFQAGTVKSKGKVVTDAGEVEFTQESMYMLPDKVKELAEIDIGGNKVKSVAVINGDKMSLEVNGMNIEVKGAIKDTIEEGRKSVRIARLLPLREKKYELSQLGEAKVLDKPAVGIRVTAKGMKDINLYFDKTSGLLVKIEKRVLNPANGQEVTEERIIAEYKTVDGMAAAKKLIIKHDGKKYMELEIGEVKFLEKIDDAEFKKE